MACHGPATALWAGGSLLQLLRYHLKIRGAARSHAGALRNTLLQTAAPTAGPRQGFLQRSLCLHCVCYGRGSPSASKRGHENSTAVADAHHFNILLDFSCQSQHPRQKRSENVCLREVNSWSLYLTRSKRDSSPPKRNLKGTTKPNARYSVSEPQSSRLWPWLCRGSAVAALEMSLGSTPVLCCCARTRLREGTRSPRPSPVPAPRQPPSQAHAAFHSFTAAEDLKTKSTLDRAQSGGQERQRRPSLCRQPPHGQDLRCAGPRLRAPGLHGEQHTDTAAEQPRAPAGLA